MVVQLLQHEHGKGRVRVLKVTRTPEKHTVIQMDVEVLLEGPAERAYYNGDNSGVLPTDSVKNTVYVIAKKHEFATIEDFSILLAKHFINKHPSIIDVAKVKVKETEWIRLVTPDSNGQMKPHQHAFVGGNTGIFNTSVIARKSRQGGEPVISVQSGISGISVLKTSKSAFVDFFRDEYTTLPDVPDRLVGSVVTATWNYTPDAGRRCFRQQAEEIKRTMINAFAGPSDVGVDSPAVQFTLYKMGQAVLDKCPAVKDITITMPNVHNLPVDTARFGFKNIHPHGEVFLPTDEPHGIIRATMVRSTSKL